MNDRHRQDTQTIMLNDACFVEGAGAGNGVVGAVLADVSRREV